MGAAKATLKILFFVLGCILIMPLQGLVLLFTKGRGACVIPLIWHRAMCWNFQIRCKVVGTPNAAHQTLYMSNHISYLDISALSTVIPYSFVAKSEVQGWPLFGALAKLQRTAFIVRKRSQIVQETNAIAKRLEDGDSLIIFPEGTSSTGFDVLPFKSSLFTLALDGSAENLYVQPVTIRVLEVDGRKPETKEEQDVYAWPRDMELELHQHLWRFAKTNGAVLELTFHEALKASDFTDRKVLAQACWQEVSKPLALLPHAA